MTRLRQPRAPRGFTLLETSMAIGLMMVLGGAMVVMLQQHLTFLGITSRQAFLTREAPQIGNVLGRIFQQADHYFIYESAESALAGGPPVLTGGAVRLFFKTAAQTVQERLIAAAPAARSTGLRCITPLADGAESSWWICDGLQGATFSASQGILTATLAGPNGEEITYSGGAR
jgi:hypothetical protein